MNKSERAKIISTELLQILQRQGRQIPAACGSGRYNSTCHIERRYKAVLTQGCSLVVANRAGNLIREHRVFGEGCDLLEVVLEVSKRRTLALHLRGDEIEVVEYVPGIWESWFGAEAGADTTPYRIPLVPKSLADLGAWSTAKPWWTTCSPPN